jgi:predicted short-subunit dehydrogenase-like oxidoreductase (DUF2520 family)
VTPPLPLGAAGIIGLGKAGGSLAASLLLARVRLAGCTSRSQTRRLSFADRHPDAIAPVASLDELLAQLRDAGAEVLFLAAPDDAIDALAAQLDEAEWLPPVVAHLSGSRGAEALAPLASRCVPAAFHPLAALDGERPIPRDTLLAVDAARDDVAETLERLAAALHTEPARIKRGEHARYHLGAVTSANLAVALLEDGIEHLVAAGVERDLARRSLARLLDSTARAAERRELSEMLTGPIARGDEGTVARHLEILEAGDDREREQNYRALSLRLTDIAPLSDEERARLRALLSDEARAREEP